MRYTAIAALVLLGALIGAPAEAQPQCRGDGGYSCPAQDPIVPVREGYDPSDVDWNALVADVYAITDAEPRVCTMTIRAWFHDLAAHHAQLEENFSEEFVNDFTENGNIMAGSDASIFTHKEESEIEHNQAHGFTQITRHVLAQVRAAFSFVMFFQFAYLRPT